MDPLQRGFCACGCEQPTTIAKRTNSRLGHVKGEPVPYLLGHAVRRADVRAKIAAAQADRVVQTGERFGRLVVLADTGRREGGHRVLRCRCDCGSETIVPAGRLRRANGTRSCGCAIRDASSARATHPALRFLQYIGRETASGCLLWTGCCYDDGYGRFDGNCAHRFAYELTHGPTLGGLHLHHICQNRGCVNPKHLSPLSPAEHNRLHAALRVGG